MKTPKSYRPPANSLPLSLTRRQDGKINDIASFMHKLSYLQGHSKLKKDKDFTIFFRGHSDIEWDSLPSIYRNNSIYKEHILFNEIINSCPQDFRNLNTTFQKLVKMQHYSIPTRLLDITQNPLVALYFACLPLSSENTEPDGEVVVYKFHNHEICYSDDAEVNLISNLASFPDDFSVEENNIFRHQYFDDLIIKTNHQTPFDRGRYTHDTLNSVLCVKPMMENPRIVRQDGAFLIFGCDGKKENPSSSYNGILEVENYYRLVICGTAKKRILSELQLIGITPAKLFPEIDKVSDFLKETYLSD